jgi:hypothetical protein
LNPLRFAPESTPGVEIAVSLVVKLACRFHDDKRDFIGGQRFFQSLEAGRIIADALAKTDTVDARMLAILGESLGPGITRRRPAASRPCRNSCMAAMPPSPRGPPFLTASARARPSG